MKYVEPEMEFFKLKKMDIVTVSGGDYSTGSNEGDDSSDLSGGW